MTFYFDGSINMLIFKEGYGMTFTFIIWIPTFLVHPSLRTKMAMF